MIDAVEQAIWNDVQKHEDGCWTWNGPTGCSIIRLLARLCDHSLPVGVKMYRMPECDMGADCVNPFHVGTSEEWMARMRRSRRT
jgi:hypothetical protein